MEKLLLSKRTVLTMKIKLDIIHLAGKKMPHQSIAKKYGIGRSTVTKILSRKDKIIQLSSGILEDERKRIRLNEFEDIERKVLEWFGAKHKRNKSRILMLPLQYNKQIIIDKANKIAVELGRDNIITDEKWLKKFCRRHKVKFVNDIKNNSKCLSDTPNHIATDVNSLNNDTVYISSDSNDGFNYSMNSDYNETDSYTSPTSVRIEYSETKDQAVQNINYEIQNENENENENENVIIDSNNLNLTNWENNTINDSNQIINNLGKTIDDLKQNVDNRDLMIDFLSDRVSTLSQYVLSISQNVAQNNLQFNNLINHMNISNQSLNSYFSTINLYFDQINSQLNMTHYNNLCNTPSSITVFDSMSNIQGLPGFDINNNTSNNLDKECLHLPNYFFGNI